MKKMKKLTAVILLCCVTFMTLSSFTMQSQTNLVGSATLVSTPPADSGVDSRSGITPVAVLTIVLLAVIHAGIAATDRTATQKPLQLGNVDFAKENEAFLISKLG